MGWPPCLPLILRSIPYVGRVFRPEAAFTSALATVAIPVGYAVFFATRYTRKDDMVLLSAMPIALSVLYLGCTTSGPARPLVLGGLLLMCLAPNIGELYVALARKWGLPIWDTVRPHMDVEHIALSAGLLLYAKALTVGA